MSKFANLTRRFVRDDEGATLLEYGMLVLLITVLSIVAVQNIGSKVSNGFNTVNTNLPN
jgi:pilus assembly protein Flp/PilA